MKVTTGDRFGRWEAIAPEMKSRRLSGRPEIIVLCRCDCGTRKYVSKRVLVRNGAGKSRSCGCLKRELTRKRATKHGHARNEETRLYSIWSSMIQRCDNPNRKSYSDYGAKGIGVCKRWRESFELFARDMGEPPNKATLERIDNNKSYSPDNCRWATRYEQSRNTSRNRFYSFNGKTQCMKDWAKDYGISYFTLRSRLDRGMDIESALTKPSRYSTNTDKVDNTQDQEKRA